MKELTGSATSTTAASPEACIALLANAEGYPVWYPEAVKSVVVLERDASGQASKVRTKLHVQHGPITRDFDLMMAVDVDPLQGTVKLHRIPHEPSDGEKFEVNWAVNSSSATRIHLDLAANLDVPRFLPLGTIGDAIAGGFVSAATRALGT
ncbi:MAG TPA: SRPBCC family protein [Solirubrobacteraceae bacterium]|nr:SRPBCC family protein [Solirubrobacteraceae bacterium]HUA05410.1 SRPBCC family protein [Solirubrobacteraceae bacterium]